MNTKTLAQLEAEDNEGFRNPYPATARECANAGYKIIVSAIKYEVWKGDNFIERGGIPVNTGKRITAAKRQSDLIKLTNAAIRACRHHYERNRS
jgi:hypothetical protein